MDQDLFEEVQARMRDAVFLQRASERMWKSEGLFAEAKQHHGLSRARYRGRSKVQIQAYLSAIAQNLKRLVWLFYLCLNARRRVRQTRYPELIHLIPAAGLLQHARPIDDSAWLGRNAFPQGILELGERVSIADLAV